MNNKAYTYVKFQLWNKSISLHRDFVKSTILSDVDITHIMEDLVSNLFRRDNDLSNIEIKLFDKVLRPTCNVDMSILYVHKSKEYRQFVRDVLCFISDCYEYRNNDEKLSLKRILYSSIYINSLTIYGKLRRLMIPSIIIVLFDYLKIDSQVLFDCYDNIQHLLINTIHTYDYFYEFKYESMTIPFPLSFRKEYLLSQVYIKIQFIAKSRINVTYPCNQYDMTKVNYEYRRLPEYSIFIILYNNRCLLNYSNIFNKVNNMRLLR